MEFIDLFCGAGGLSLGLTRAGLTQRLAVDSDPTCVATYQRNFPKSKVLCASIDTISANQIRQHLLEPQSYILAGCPPCQLFSRLHQKQPGSDHVIFAYLELVRKLRAPYLIFENVPQLTAYSGIWAAFLGVLHDVGYDVWSQVVNAADFGVPQERKRLVVIASRLGKLSPKLRVRNKRKTVREALRGLPNQEDSISNHISMRLSKENLKRIRGIRQPGGGSREGSFSDSYSRMYWDKPAPTITTRCVSFSNGRFGHPEHDRAITVREAARLQAFPDSFNFEGGVCSAARQVGNAVPPPLAAWLGREVLRHNLERRAKVRVAGSR